MHQARGCVPAGSWGQHPQDKLEWWKGHAPSGCRQGLCLVLPAAVAGTIGGCWTLLHGQLVQRCGWSSLPSMGTASVGSATASNLAIADPCSALALLVNPDRGITFCPGMDVAWKAQHSCSVPATAQPRTGDATPKEGPEAGEHSSWSGGKPGACPVPSSLLQLLSGGFSYLWVFSVLVT